jgi:FMN-dependent NADH-azoreductase
LLAELLAADVVLVGAPMYNYSLPSTLKAWLEYIHVPGVTSASGEHTPPLAGRPAVLVTTRGIAYDEGTHTAGWDHGIPVLRLVLGSALGMSLSVIEVNLTMAEHTAESESRISRARAELAQAHQTATALASRLAPA